MAIDLINSVLGKGCKLFMDGRGVWHDDVFVEGVWRSAKYKRTYLKVCDSVGATCADITDYFNRYNPK